MSDCEKGLVAIVLAAGRGNRFRESLNVDKLLTPCDAQPDSPPVILATLRALRGVAERLVVVVRHDNDELLGWLGTAADDLNAEVLSVQSNGLGHSLAQAVASYPARRGWMVALGDMPYLKTDSVQGIAASIRPDNLVVPVYQGRSGHPRGIGCKYRDLLLGLKGDQGAQQLFTGDRLVQLPVDDPGVLLDIDRPEDLLRDASASA